MAARLSKSALSADYHKLNEVIPLFTVDQDLREVVIMPDRMTETLDVMIELLGDYKT